VPYDKSLAGTADEVRFGLPSEYAASVVEGVADVPAEITVAAHGRIGSSAFVFRRLAALLALLLEEGVPEADAALWAAWDAMR
jgi:hypothetical protein